MVVSVSSIYFCSNAMAFDYSDCLDRIERLTKEARNADDTASSASGRDALRDINYALSEVESALDKAKSACNYESRSLSFCRSMANFSATNGKKAAELICYSATGGDLNQCLLCAGIKK